jgi:hypothetical protein
MDYLSMKQVRSGSLRRVQTKVFYDPIIYKPQNSLNKVILVPPSLTEPGNSKGFSLGEPLTRLWTLASSSRWIISSKISKSSPEQTR